MKFLFITNEVDQLPDARNQSTRYRCLYPAIALTEYGHHCDITSLGYFAKHRNLTYDVYIFRSPFESTLATNLYRSLINRNLNVYADFDDLIFDENFYEGSIYSFHDAAKMDSLYALKKVISHKEALKQFDKIIVATDYLAGKIKEIFSKEARVISAAIPDKTARLMKNNRGNSIANRIAFAFGSRASSKSTSHDLHTLERQLVTNPDLNVTLIGSIDIKEKTFLSLPNLSVIKRLSYFEYIKVLGKHKYLINYQELDPLNSSKSRIKALEANLLGQVILSSRVPDYVKVEQDGLPINFIADLKEAFDLCSKNSINFSQQKNTYEAGTKYLVQEYEALAEN